MTEARGWRDAKRVPSDIYISLYIYIGHLRSWKRQGH